MNTLHLIALSVILLLPIQLQCSPAISRAILVVGGAGFIGSHVNEMLFRQGYKTIVLDNLSHGSRDSVKNGLFIEGDLADADLLDQIFSSHQIDAVMHFAALKDVGESVKEPLSYYENNVSNTLNLLKAMHRHHVKILISPLLRLSLAIQLRSPFQKMHPLPSHQSLW